MLAMDYISKLIKTVAPNGYKFDVANYLYNPACDCEYPVQPDGKSQVKNLREFWKNQTA